MKFIIVALALLSVCLAQSSDADWERYQREYSKKYRSVAENANRRAIWEENWKLIKRHNEEYAQGRSTYTLGENQFADMTYEEFSQKYLGLNVDVNAMKSADVYENTARPAIQSHDLRNNGWVTPIRDQGSCGGCWAFAVVAAVESVIAKANGWTSNSLHLSEQQLIDCSKGGYVLFILPNNKGCSGGLLEGTYNDIKSTGLQSDSTYPYAMKDGTCVYDKNQVVTGTRISGYKAVAKDELSLLNAVEAGYAVSVGIHASSNFQLYKNGVFKGNATENSASLNHAVVIVGYDLTHAEPHYIIKNSWSTKWGENGYVRLGYGDKHLSVHTLASYPLA